MNKAIIRMVSLAMVLLMLVPAVACTGNAAEYEREIGGLNAKIEYLEQELELAKNQQPDTVVETVTETEVKEVRVPADMVVGVDCTLNGEAAVMADELVKVHAVAEIPEGMAFDHWEIMGEGVQAVTPEADFEVSGTGTVRAVLHEERVLKCVNCYFQFLKSETKADGDKLTEFNFEEDYVNPVTKENCEGGMITGQVTAEIPKGYDVDYWLINGVKYEPDDEVKSFIVTDLDEATEYEVVLVKENAKYYKVTCTNCTFSGGGYKNAKSGKVKAGTKITVSPTVWSTGWWTGTYTKGSQTNPVSSNSITYTIKKDSKFTWNFVIN